MSPRPLATDITANVTEIAANSQLFWIESRLPVHINQWKLIMADHLSRKPWGIWGTVAIAVAVLVLALAAPGNALADGSLTAGGTQASISTSVSVPAVSVSVPAVSVSVPGASVSVPPVSVSTPGASA